MWSDLEDPKARICKYRFQRWRPTGISYCRPSVWGSNRPVLHLLGGTEIQETGLQQVMLLLLPTSERFLKITRRRRTIWTDEMWLDDGSVTVSDVDHCISLFLPREAPLSLFCLLSLPAFQGGRERGLSRRRNFVGSLRATDSDIHHKKIFTHKHTCIAFFDNVV